MQRVRIGLTGLSCVFLLVLLAAAFLGLANGEADRADMVAGQGSTASADNVVEAPKDPLAELGVAPGNGPEEPAAPSGGTSGTR